MMQRKFVTWTEEDGMAIVMIDYAPMNVLSEQVIEELDEVIDEVAEEETVRSMIISGAGDRAFVAGGNIKDFPKWIGNGKKAGKERALWIQSIFNKLDRLNKPTIAAINGMALGGGSELALCCDLRIAERHAIFGLPEIKLGLFPGAGGTQRLPRLIGKAKAKELMFTGRTVSAEEAEDMGLVNQVVPSGESLTRAKELMREINQFSLPALSFIKRAVDDGIEKDLEAGLETEATYFGEVFQTEDVKIGVEAFINKKKPFFQHR
ncbi:enoyl-CoA hydratase [Bacillaceae bacterium SAS-127]|nr:enoyl-CoA hydratase [Bacillaceae bacterium SAS-127]